MRSLGASPPRMLTTDAGVPESIPSAQVLPFPSSGRALSRPRGVTEVAEFPASKHGLPRTPK